MSELGLSDSYECLCYGSMAIIKLSDLNSHPVEGVSRYHDPQLQQGSYSTVWIFFHKFSRQKWFFHDKIQAYTGHKIVEECITSHGLDKNVHHNIFFQVFHDA